MPRRAPKLSSSPPPTSATPISPAPLLSVAATKKLKLYTEQLKAGTPFVQHSRPTPEEAEEVCKLLASVHGMPTRPEKLVDREDAPAGCGQVPSVLDAVVRTCLSANTTRFALFPLSFAGFRPLNLLVVQQKLDGRQAVDGFDLRPSRLPCCPRWRTA